MGNFFCGWYLKCQNNHQSLALIPAYHICGGVRRCSLQLITGGQTWTVSLEGDQFLQTGEEVRIGTNHFTRQGVILSLHTPDLVATGVLHFGPFSPLAYDIMGPFRFVPFLQCRHSVLSMGHTVHGQITINGQSFAFDQGLGYVEGDQGRSFPREYLWTHCFFSEGSLMLSVADIPFCGTHFTGIICAIAFRGKEYRLSTYLGARVEMIQQGTVIVRQGRNTLTVQLMEPPVHPLAAPQSGEMGRTIHESIACHARYRFQVGGSTAFDFESDQASFEYEYPW